LTPIVILDRRAARHHGLSRRNFGLARAWHLDLVPDLAILDGGLIVDVGAHEGSWTDAVLQISPTFKVIAVEPQDDLREVIGGRFAGDARVTVDGRALSDHIGESTFNLLGASVNGSLHQPRPRMNSVYGSGWERERTITVPTTTLDQLVGDNPVALLKIDVQGAEAEVLRGAQGALKRTNIVMLEVTFFSHYDGDTTFVDLHSMMADAGFSLAGVAEPARSKLGAMMCSDACYVSNRLLEDVVSSQ
jgi:FkbM family methyltransferase